MAGKVIQGWFIRAPARQPGTAAQARPGARPPPTAFGAAVTTAQARRPGAQDAWTIDPAALGITVAGGRALPDRVRAGMEAALGADFSRVRVHVGPQAERIGAVAFTLGTDIYFAPGRFQPETVHGRQLLGHELAHVVQQRQGRVRNPAGRGVAIVQDPTLEAEADRLGHRAAACLGAAQAKPAPGARLPGVPAQRRVFHAPAAVQRMESGFERVDTRDAAELLRDLAAPIVFSLPDKIVDKEHRVVELLEHLIAKGVVNYMGQPPIASCLGAVELSWDLSDGKLVKIVPSKGIPDIHDQIAPYPGIGKDIVKIVMSTLRLSGQMNYLERSGLTNSAEWKVVAEVHYYRDRNVREYPGFHKDTLGETVFVNLNFITGKDEGTVDGPEYVLNPPLADSHEDRLKQTLPYMFRAHLAHVRKSLPPPTRIGATQVKPNQVVGFVDEFIAHKSPLYFNRNVSAAELDSYLKKRFPFQYISATHELDRRQANVTSPFATWVMPTTWLRDPGIVACLRGIELIRSGADRFDRAKLGAAGIPGDLIDEVIDLHGGHKSIDHVGSSAFRSVSIPDPTQPQSVTAPVRGPGTAPLERQKSSQALLPMPKTRRFFRTWVRTIRRTDAERRAYEKAAVARFGYEVY